MSVYLPHGSQKLIPSTNIPLATYNSHPSSLQKPSSVFFVQNYHIVLLLEIHVKIFKISISFTKCYFSVMQRFLTVSSARTREGEP